MKCCRFCLQNSITLIPLKNYKISLDLSSTLRDLCGFSVKYLILINFILVFNLTRLIMIVNPHRTCVSYAVKKLK